MKKFEAAGWVGAGAKLMRGVNVGEDSVIFASLSRAEPPVRDRWNRQNTQRLERFTGCSVADFSAAVNWGRTAFIADCVKWLPSKRTGLLSIKAGHP